MSVCTSWGDANGGSHGSANTAAATEPTAHWGRREELRGAGEAGSAPTYHKRRDAGAGKKSETSQGGEAVQSTRQGYILFFFSHVNAVVMSRLYPLPLLLRLASWARVLLQRRCQSIESAVAAERREHSAGDSA